MSIDHLNSRSARVAQRSCCTGETANMVRRQLKAGSGPLMPEATTGGQLELEAALLLASNRVMRRMRHEEVSAGGAPFINRVRLATRELSLEVAEHAVERFLAESLPSVVGGRILGIPGLRPRPGRDHLDLRLIGLGSETHGEVRLLGVSRARWREAAKFLETMGGADVRPWLECQDDLHEGEQALLRERVTQPTELMSAVLRRFPLWRDAAWIDSAVIGDSLHMRWQAGPGERTVASILADSVCGVPGAAVASRQVSSTIRSILLSRAELIPRTQAEIESWAYAQLDGAGMSGSRAGQEFSTTSKYSVSLIHPDIWQIGDMREALAARDVSSVYRMLRRVGISQRQIAALTGQSILEVSDVLKGREVVDCGVLTRIADGLGVPRSYMGLAGRDMVNRKNSPSLPSDEEAARRRFLMHAAAVTVGAAVLGVGNTLGGDWRDRSRRFVNATLTDREQKAAEGALRALRQ